MQVTIVRHPPHRHPIPPHQTFTTPYAGLVWWMSYFTHDVFDARCGRCLILCMVWSMSGVLDVRCGGSMSFFTNGVVDVWCGGFPILPMVWWMSCVVNVCVVDVVQSRLQIIWQNLENTICTIWMPSSQQLLDSKSILEVPKLCLLCPCCRFICPSYDVYIVNYL